MYLMYYDDSRRPADTKIAEGCAAYARRFGHSPDTVLVNAAQIAVVAGVTVRSETRIEANNFQIGVEATS
jgi:hypothetical protein